MVLVPETSVQVGVVLVLDNGVLGLVLVLENGLQVWVSPSPGEWSSAGLGSVLVPEAVSLDE